MGGCGAGGRTAARSTEQARLPAMAAHRALGGWYSDDCSETHSHGHSGAGGVAAAAGATSRRAAPGKCRGRVWHSDNTGVGSSPPTLGRSTCGGEAAWCSRLESLLAWRLWLLPLDRSSRRSTLSLATLSFGRFSFNLGAGRATAVRGGPADHGSFGARVRGTRSFKLPSLSGGPPRLLPVAASERRAGSELRSGGGGGGRGFSLSSKYNKSSGGSCPCRNAGAGSASDSRAAAGEAPAGVTLEGPRRFCEEPSWAAIWGTCCFSRSKSQSIPSFTEAGQPSLDAPTSGGTR